MWVEWFGIQYLPQPIYLFSGYWFKQLSINDFNASGIVALIADFRRRY